MVLVYRDQGRNAYPSQEGLSDQCPRALRCHHDDVNVLWRYDPLEMNVESVREGEDHALPQVGRDVLVIDVLLDLIRYQEHHQVRALDGVRDVHDLHPVRLGPVPCLVLDAESQDDIHTAVPQVQRLRSPLDSISHDRYPLALQDLEVRVLVEIG